MKGVNIIFHLCMGLKNQNQFAVSVNSKFIIAVKNCYDLLSILLGDNFAITEILLYLSVRTVLVTYLKGKQRQ